MNCEQYQENVSQFIDGELESVNEANLFKHLSTCDACREFIKETMSLRSELLSMEAATVPEPLYRKILTNSIASSSIIRPMSHRFGWMKRDRMISLRAVGFALVITVLASVVFTSLWYRLNVASQETIIYVSTLPTVEVRGYIPSSSNVTN